MENVKVTTQAENPLCDRLRKKFEGWSEFEIESVRGLGYKAVKKI